MISCGLGLFVSLFQMIEISMNVCAEHLSGKKVSCCVSATAVHRNINLEGATGRWLNNLALAVRGTRCPLLQHFDMVSRLTCLPAVFVVPVL